ncbi:MAG TPA: tetratricopeptide repeat protein [Oligoflexia bacterium]|nr:tetratricopeptide repeat protein [Oligoflexia bacterium]HMP26772.1 tetratricopeptide repeat protein [Oligoflexia bacterium]
MLFLIRDLQNTWLNIKTEIVRWSLKRASDDWLEAFAYYVRSQLIKKPFWFRGHLFFARYGREKKDLQFAYASALALERLARTAHQRFLAKLELANTHLACGNFEQALSIFRSIFERKRANFEVLCGQALALFGLTKYKEARETLELIPKEKRVPEVSLLLDSINAKLL